MAFPTPLIYWRGALQPGFDSQFIREADRLNPRTSGTNLVHVVARAVRVQ